MSGYEMLVENHPVGVPERFDSSFRIRLLIRLTPISIFDQTMLSCLRALIISPWSIQDVLNLLEQS